MEVYRSPSNQGWSYGSWHHAVQKYQGFDHYLFLEDDYAFVKDDFDTTLVQMWEEREYREVEFLCNFYHLPNAIVTNGVSSGKALEARNWRLLDATSDTDGFIDFLGSVRMSGFSKLYHCAPYFGTHVHPGLIVCGQGEYLIAPTHAIDPRTLGVDLPDGTPHLHTD